jgi:hypothetical protein
MLDRTLFTEGGDVPFADTGFLVEDGDTHL